MEARPQGGWNELRDKRQLVALDVSGDQQGLRLLGFDAALVIHKGVLEDGRETYRLPGRRPGKGALSAHRSHRFG